MNRSSSAYDYDVTPRRGYGGPYGRDFEGASARRYEERGSTSRMAVAKTADVYLMNTIAVALGLAAIALFVVGMLVGTGVTGANASTAQNFQYGSVWLLGSIVLAIAGLTFRREHHIPDSERLPAASVRRSTS